MNIKAKSHPVSLFDAAARITEIEALLDAETLDEAAIAERSDQYLEATGLAEDAINRYAYLIEQRTLRQKNRLSEAKHQREIADGLRNLADQDERLVKRLKHRLLVFMDARGVKKLETDRFKINAQNNGGEAPLLIDEEYSMRDIIEQYPELLSVELDHSKVRTALKAGKALPFAGLGERGRSVRIKP